MSDASAFDFGKFIPGFDFLQQLAARPAGPDAPAPAIGGWVAPTVSIEELERRIKELQAVQFWLNQNATAIKATIQALEVQKMTLATLQGMNLGMNEVAKAFTLPKAAAAPATSAPPAWPYAGAQAQQTVQPAEPAAQARPARKPKPKPKPKPAAASGLPDPMQWWNALTQQFQQIAANTLREQAGAAAEGMAPAPPAASATRQAEPPKTAARKKTPAKKTARKTAARTRAKAPRKTAPKAAAQPAARSPLPGWPLPPPFKLGR